MKVVAIIVAYNNHKELKELIDKLLNQTYKLFKIVVVDNSTNLSEQKTNKNMCLSKKMVEYIRVENNIGSAGGFELGMRISDKYSPDYLWLNDQDGFPSIDCLEVMINGDPGNKTGIIAPLVCDKYEYEKKLYNFRNNENIFGKSIPIFNKKNDNVVSFIKGGTAGLLISKELYKTIGFYDSEKFFVGKEDNEYCLRSIQHNFNNILIWNAIYFHPDLYKKYSKKNFSIMKIAWILPVNFGIVTRNDNLSEKKIKSEIFIMKEYHNYFIYLVNLFYSFLRSVITKFIHFRDVKLYNTIKCYLRS